MNLAQFNDVASSRLTTLFTQYVSASSHPAIILTEAMSYSLTNGGKRIRPLLVYLTGHVFDTPWENLDGAAAAIEMIHAYSLIHDDLPAMDNADVRRGKPACHKAFNEATAILAGDALQPLAFEILATHPSPLTSEQRVKMIKTLAHASGAAGMAGGQSLDLAGVSTLESLTQMYRLKTGALLSASVTLGMVAANVSHPPLEEFIECIGLAFQIQDDLLDIEGTLETTGKPQGTDAINQKITYPTLAGIQASRDKVCELFERAMDSIEFLGEKSILLKELACLLLQRKK